MRSSAVRVTRSLWDSIGLVLEIAFIDPLGQVDGQRGRQVIVKIFSISILILPLTYIYFNPAAVFHPHHSPKVSYTFLPLFLPTANNLFSYPLPIPTSPHRPCHNPSVAHVNSRIPGGTFTHTRRYAQWWFSEIMVWAWKTVTPNF